MDAISRQTGASFIVEDKIQQRKFSAIMENVNLRDALRALLEAQGLGYEQIGESNTFVIKEYSETRSRLATRIFRLKYTQLTNIPTPQINLGGGSSKGGFSAVALTKEARPAADDKDGGGFISVIQSALTDKGRIQVYAETNSLIISDIPENFPNIEELIEKLDTPVPQVMIEVYFVETTVDTSKNLGISYGTDGTLAQFQGNSQLVNFPLTMNGSAAGFPAMDWSQFSKGSAYVVNSNAYFGGVSFGILSFQQLVATLKAVMTDGQGQFLAKPKVMTLNNKAAQIAVTADTVVEFDVKQFTGAGYLGEQSKTAKRQETGITLWVTPQVNEGGTITLTLTPQISRPQNSTFFPTDKVVDTQKRSITTTIRVSDGSTVLIGGLLSNEDSNTTQKVPILGDIPIIGKLFFSQVNDKKSKRELLIFITPKIVKNNG
jgi:type IV pilus secretin PilQ/predicted competence protein